MECLAVEARAINLGQTMGGAFGRRGLQVVEIAGLGLNGGDLFAQEVQRLKREGLADLCRQVLVHEVGQHFVRPDHAQGGEVIRPIFAGRTLHIM
ncbi:MAG: hypothetical protein NTW86_14725 [Candidatus Sumerlaeota bacterium]|nr:hypothetical protein [Candidatus Sumerlaeota bacterium]